MPSDRDPQAGAPDLPDTLELRRLFDADIKLAPGEPVGDTPFGRRTIFIVEGGTIDGPRIRGAVHAGGGDWLLSSADGHNELDVRGTIETDDGALIYMWYRGVLRINDAVAGRALSGERASSRDYYFRTTPRFETGAAAYGWLNDVVCVAHGWIGPNRVAYRVFEVL